MAGINGNAPCRGRRKKPLSEIQTGTENLRQAHLSSFQNLLSLIFSVQYISDDDRCKLLNAAIKLNADAVHYTGLATRFIIEQKGRKKAEHSRAGNTTRAAKWHEQASKLAKELWAREPLIRSNAFSTANGIHGDLKKFCDACGRRTPKAGTVAKYLSKLDCTKV
jgi:hypothetical protein